MAIRRYTFRLYPNKTQERELFAARRLHCYLFNACIAHRRFEWKKNQKTVDYFQQQNCLPAFKKEWVEFAYLHSQALQSTVKRVDLGTATAITCFDGKEFQEISNPRFTQVTENKVKNLDLVPRSWKPYRSVSFRATSSIS